MYRERAQVVVDEIERVWHASGAAASVDKRVVRLELMTRDRHAARHHSGRVSGSDPAERNTRLHRASPGLEGSRPGAHGA